MSATLVCPACRHFEGGDLHVRTLATGDHALLCDCGASYPVVDGVPLVFRDLSRWLASEGSEVLRRFDLPEPTLRGLAAGAGGALARNEALRAVYAASRLGPLQDWLRATIAGIQGTVLELGCGLGASSRADVVALDHNFGLIRGHPGIRICSDAADPPFLPNSFDCVVLPNLLDSCEHPALVLAQADALLRPGGHLVLSCAYAFQDSVTPDDRRFSPIELINALSGAAALQGYRFAHRVVEQVERIDWPIVVSDRTRHVHQAHAIISRKTT